MCLVTKIGQQKWVFLKSDPIVLYIATVVFHIDLQVCLDNYL